MAAVLGPLLVLLVGCTQSPDPELPLAPPSAEDRQRYAECMEEAGFPLEELGAPISVEDPRALTDEEWQQIEDNLWSDPKVIAADARCTELAPSMRGPGIDAETLEEFERQHRDYYECMRARGWEAVDFGDQWLIPDDAEGQEAFRQDSITCGDETGFVIIWDE